MPPSLQFGRIPSQPDPRDYRLADFMPGRVARFFTALTFTSRTWLYPRAALNQGTTPHCVGFSMASFGNCEPTFDTYVDADGHQFYAECKRVDGMPTQDGSTIRAAAKVLKARGRIPSYAFAATVDEIKWWILNRSPVIVGTVWTEGMLRPDTSYVIRATGKVLGGHAYLLLGYDGTHFRGLNSWGRWWGNDGQFKIPEADFKAIFAQGGEAVTAVEVAEPDKPVPPKPAAPEKNEPGYVKRHKRK